MALTTTDLVLAGYQLFFAIVLITRGPFEQGRGWLLLSCLLFGVLLALFRLCPAHPLRRQLPRSGPISFGP